MTLEIDSKWENFELEPADITSVSYVGKNHFILETKERDFELIDFAATKLHRMTNTKSRLFYGAFKEDKFDTVSKYCSGMLKILNDRNASDLLVLRILKEDDMVKSIVGKSYIPIDMEELESHAEQILVEGGILDYNVERYKSNYARGYDTTRYMMNTGEKEASAVGDLIGIGLQIKNNELGTRGVSLSLFIQRLECLNGMCSFKTEQTLKTTHIGSKESILVEFDQTATLIIDSAWGVLDEINRSSSIQMAQEQMNNFVDHVIKNNKISGKIGSKIKLAIEKENYGANKENVWGLINAITGVSSHDSSHGVRDKLEIIASDLLDIKKIEQIEKQLIKIEIPN